MADVMLSSPIPPRLSIWTSPRATIRTRLAADPTPAMWLFPVLSGIAQSLVQGASNSVGLRGSVGMVLGMAIPIGAAWGILQLHMVAGTLWLVGKWTGGRATFKQLRIALAWASAPQALVVVVWLAGTLLAGRFLYVDPESLNDGQVGAALVAMVVWVATLAGGVWWLILVVLGIAEAQGVSVWKALGNFIVAGLMLGLVLTIVVMAALMLTSG